MATRASSMQQKQFERQVTISNSDLDKHETYQCRQSVPVKKEMSKRVETLLVLMGLTITTTLSSILLAVTILGWSTTGSLFRFVTDNRSWASFVVQVISTLLGLVYINAVCQLINRYTRLRLRMCSVSIDTLQLWKGLSTATPVWNSGCSRNLTSLVFVMMAFGPAALWAASIAPVDTLAMTQLSVPVPAFNNISLIREYPLQAEIDSPLIRNAHGLFAFAVGKSFLGQLLASASSVRTANQPPRIHQKYDNTQFNYIGRSYGTGGGVGLADSPVLLDASNIAYSFVEDSYDVHIKCVYNQSSNFTFVPIEDKVYAAIGTFPDSSGPPKYSEFFGNKDNARGMVALGVAIGPPPSPRRYVSIAAGAVYQSLNSTQCVLEFIPTSFNVSVNITDQTITADRLATIDEFDQSHNISAVVTRQLDLITCVQTNLYMSVVGDSLESAIRTYNDSVVNSSQSRSADYATLRGIENWLTAMVDDMLVCYKSAQLIIAGDTIPRQATVQYQAMTFGTDIFIYLLFALNLIIVLAWLIEAFRTKFWKDLPRLDYTEIQTLLPAMWMGALTGDKSVKAPKIGPTGISDGSELIVEMFWRNGNEILRLR